MPPVKTTPATPMIPIAVILWVSRNEKKLMGIPDYRHLMRSARSAPLPQDEAVGLGFYGRVNPRPVVVPKSPDYCAQPVRMQPVYEAVLRQERNGMRPPRLIKRVGERRLLSEAPTGNWAANSSAHSSSKLPVTTPINGRGDGDQSVERRRSGALCDSGLANGGPLLSTGGVCIP